MLRFIARRLLVGLGILLISSFIMYMLTDFSMDYYADLRGRTDPNLPFLIEQRTQLLDLETPAYLRYFKWLGAFVTGDLGTAWTTGTPVSKLLASAIVSTLQLVTAATFLAIFLGVAVGIISALRQYTSFDYIITFVSFVLYSLPAFWVAVLLKEFGAIGFNDFLRDPVLAGLTIAAVAVVFALMWMLALGGGTVQRARNFGLAAAATAGVLLFMQLTDWWSYPNIGIVMLALASVGIAATVTLLSTGLRNRRSLGTAMTVAALGVVLYYPMQWVFYWITPWMSWGLALALGLLAMVVGGLIGALWRGPDWRQSVRTGVLTALPVSALIFIDRVMQEWPAYNRKSQINFRPIATIGDRTPNLKGDFWMLQVDNYTHLVLPTISLLLISFAGYTRYARGSMLEVMNQDYIRTARAKGLTERTVVMRHGFRNAMIPLATIVPIDIVTLVGGAIITERIFGRPGMGQLFLKSLSQNEIEPVMAYVLLIAALAIIANIIADIVYALLDPRIRINA